MNKIIHTDRLAEGIRLIKVEAPLIAKKVQPGQFVVVRIDERGERMPLTVADKDIGKGTITVIFQEAGASTKLLGKLKPGDLILNLLGPLGKPTKIEKYGTVVVIGGGVGIAEICPVVKGMREAGNKVITIIGARSQELLICEAELRAQSTELRITTDDGLYERKGFVSDVLKELIEGGLHIDLVYAVGPVPMMEVVSNLTRSHNIKTLVSLNPLMLDATGMCGVCRVVIAGKTMFACVDGPEFDAHLVDFVELRSRLDTYKDKEREALDHVCKAENAGEAGER
ncbi:MAG: sulfide/dihydroorotate dehydrogenase-like FAD/NAD-binding protein [Candidatus Saganbacteria bacterium]|nr:sulfide/dihydroorotate dehydrogenase-like FAD/NAD-binding protein [Candidatus Saganbacteria bacterium]